MSDTFYREIYSSPDVVLVSLSDSADFSQFGGGVLPRGFFCTADGNIKITTAAGRTLTLPVIADKDYLLLVKRFWNESFTATACYAFQ